MLTDGIRMGRFSMIGNERLLTNDWQILKFSECIKQLNTGLNPRNHFSLGHGSLKYITAKNLTQFGTIDFSKCDFIDEQAKRIIHRRSDIQVGDILFSSRAPIGHCHLICEKPDDYDIGESIFSIRVNRKIILPDYLCLYMASDYFVRMASLHTTGSIIQEIRISDLMDTDVILPPMNEQRRIAECFKKIDRKIALNNKINDNLAQQLRLLYDYWFTQFDFPDESGNPYRSSGGQMVWSNDAKKELPASWNSAKMSDAIEGIRTGLNPRDNFKLGNGTIKYITVKNLRSDGILDFSGCDTIDETARAIVHRRSDVCTGDILFASIAPLGRCHLVQELPQDWDINESVFSIRCNKATVTPEYLYMHLQSEAFVKESTACSTGSVFKGIRINTLLDSRVFLPPMQVIEKFSQQTKPLFSLQYKLNKEIQALTQLRDWLLPMLMNGQATVSD